MMNLKCLLIGNAPGFSIHNCKPSVEERAYASGNIRVLRSKMTKLTVNETQLKQQITPTDFQ